MKILYVSTISDTVNAFLVPHIRMLIDTGHEVDVAFNIEQDLDPKIRELGCKVYQIPFQRTPFAFDNIKAYKQIKQIIQQGNYDIVHTHTPVASALVRMACRNIDTSIYYTAHGFHFYKGAPLLNWLMYYPVEKYLSRYTDTLITMNDEDYSRAKNFKKPRVVKVSGVGVNTEAIRKIVVDKLEKRKDLNIPEDAFLILSVGELSVRKNHEVIIKALAQANNSNIHYAICGQGDLNDQLQELSKSLGLEEQVHFLGYRKDIPEICLASDCFVFSSFQEGLPVALMEAMAAGLPVVASNIRGNTDLLSKEGGYLLPPADAEAFADTLQIVANLPTEKLRNMGEYNKELVKKYELGNVLEEMREIYSEVN